MHANYSWIALWALFKIQPSGFLHVSCFSKASLNWQSASLSRAVEKLWVDWLQHNALTFAGKLQNSCDQIRVQMIGQGKYLFRLPWLSSQTSNSNKRVIQVMNQQATLVTKLDRTNLTSSKILALQVLDPAQNICRQNISSSARHQLANQLKLKKDEVEWASLWHDVVHIELPNSLCSCDAHITDLRWICLSQSHSVSSDHSASSQRNRQGLSTCKRQR